MVDPPLPHHEFLGDDETSDVESLLLAAGNWVDASPDLRPRTLEDAKLTRSELSIQKTLGTLALLVVGWFSISRPVVPDESWLWQHGPVPLSWPRASDAPSAEMRAGWDLVEAFQALRQQQAQRLNKQTF